MANGLLSEHWHHIHTDELLTLLGTDAEDGLGRLAVEDRRERFGSNSITPPPRQGPLARFFIQFHQPLVYLLLASVLVTALLEEWVDSGVIFGVTLVNAIIGFLQETRAITALDALGRSMTSTALAMRDGEAREVAAVDLVPGDVVLLKTGDKVPADMRLMSTQGLEVDESMLTGESVAVEKVEGPLPVATLLGDRSNMSHAGTLVTRGRGRGVVVATGDSSEIGQLSSLIATTQGLETPLTRKMAKVSGFLLYAILAMAALTFGVGLRQGSGWIDMLLASVALAVGAIPEGLPAAVTITLAIGVARMAGRHVVIRQLPAVEALGGITVICADKTGTLTKNEMTVTRVAAGGDFFNVTGTGYSPQGWFMREGERVEVSENGALAETLRAGLLCNDSRIVASDRGYTAEGNPTERALAVAAIKAGIVHSDLQTEFPRVDEIPFESSHRIMATLHHGVGDEGVVVYVKGSAESVLDRCADQLDAEGRRGPLNRAAAEATVERFAEDGLRVLIFAKLRLPAPGALALDDLEGLTLLGVQGMEDPLREESREAVDACRRAGIDIKMITGDHPQTAVAIAKRLGMSVGPDVPNGGVLSGSEIQELSDIELIREVQQTPVFARVTPQQKLRLVCALQIGGHSVAMTGDGANDAAALRRANVGIAMGSVGTEVAREAADIVLTNDDFASITAAVEEGRAAYDNLHKFLVWTLPTNIGLGLLVVVATVAGLALPILPSQILWINMTTAVAMGLMLSFEPREEGIMERPPRPPRAPVITGHLVFRIFSVGALLVAGSFFEFRYELLQEGSIDSARTAAVNVFVLGQFFYLLNSRSLTKSMFQIGVFSNRWLVGGSVVMLILQGLFTYHPLMNRLFRTAPVGFDDWGLIVVIGFVIFVAVGLEKVLMRPRGVGPSGERQDREPPA